MKKLKLFSMFSGYGGAEFALQKAGIDFEVVGYSEINKFAIQCYEQNHTNKRKLKLDEHLVLTDRIKEAHKNNFPIYKVSKIRNYGDATKIKAEELPDFDLLTGGFPCQSFSVAGKGAGVCDARGTLFWDIWRIAKEKQPKYMLLENVKGLTSKRHKETFDKILKDLDEIGYDVHWKVLNSKEYGIPQNRERVWFVCIRKDLEQSFEFPEKAELKIFLKDILEDDVDEKYYLTEKNIKHLQRSFGSKGQDLTGKKVANTLTSAMGTGGGNVPVLKQVGMIKQACIKRSNNTPKEINQFLKDNKGGLTLREIAEKIDLPKTQVEHYFRVDNSRAIPNPTDWEKLKQLLNFNDKFDKMVTETYEKEVTFESTRRVYSENGISPTISSTNADKIIQSNTRIRKLTPTECFRLMGFLDDEINLDGLSNTQKYKLAGNGWEINVVSKIFKNLL